MRKNEMNVTAGVKTVQQMLEEIGLANNLPAIETLPKLEQLKKNATIANSHGALITLKKSAFPKGDYAKHVRLVNDYCKALYINASKSSKDKHLKDIVIFLDGADSKAIEPLLISNIHKNIERACTRLFKRKTDDGKAIYSALSTIKTTCNDANRIIKEQVEKLPNWLNVQFANWNNNPLVKSECLVSDGDIESFKIYAIAKYKENNNDTMPNTDDVKTMVDIYINNNTIHYIDIPESLKDTFNQVCKDIKEYLDNDIEHGLHQPATLANITESQMVQLVEYAVGSELVGMKYVAKFFGVEEKEELKKQVRIENANAGEYGSTWQKRKEKAVDNGLMSLDKFNEYYVNKDVDGYKAELEKAETEKADGVLKKEKAKTEKAEQKKA